jgi:hypothetical protein
MFLFRIFIAVVCACGITISCSHHMLTKTKPLFSFIFCSDLHIQDSLGAQAFREYVNAWNSSNRQFDFIVIGGDIIEHGSGPEFAFFSQEIASLKKSWYPIIGNHDCTPDTDSAKAAYCHAVGTNRENYCVVHKGVRLIFLDLTEGTKAHVSVQSSTVRWCDSVLDSRRTLPTLVLSHFPLHSQTPEFAVANTDTLFSVFDRQPILGYISGHWHGLWNNNRNNVPFFVCPPLLPGIPLLDGTNRRGYLWVDVFKDHIAVSFQEAICK